MSSSNTTPSLQVDATRLMGSLKYAFSGNLSVLGELLQNARRAGATQINVSLSFPEYGISAEALAKNMDINGVQYYGTHSAKSVSVMSLSVVDDGSGIEDMGVLLHVAHSGWDQDTQQEEHPYGLGFLSALFSASEVEVVSHGKVMYLDTGKVLSGQGGVVVEDRETPPGAAVHLARFTLPSSQTVYDIVQSISLMVRGFPVPVALNGVDIPRTHAPTGGLPVSDILLQPVAYYGLQCYLQGLPVKFSSGGRGTCLAAYLPEEYVPLILGDGNRGIALHLPSAVFRGRMPDRSHLYQEDEARARIDDFMSDWQVGELSKVLDKLPDSRLPEFSNAVTYLLRAEDLQKMFQGRGVVPGVYDSSMLTRNSSCSISFPSTRPKCTVATLKDVEEGRVLACSNASVVDALHVTTLISRYKYFAGAVWARAYPDLADQCQTWEEALEDVLGRDLEDDANVWSAVADSAPVSDMAGKVNLMVGWYEELMHPGFQSRVVVHEAEDSGHICVGLPKLLQGLPQETRLQIVKDVSDWSVPTKVREAALRLMLKLTGDDGPYLLSLFSEASMYFPHRDAIRNRSFTLSFGANGDLIRVGSK